MTETKKVDLQKAFLQRQKLLSSELEIPLEFTSHPTTIGDASEANWTRMLKSFLPGRYEVGGVAALDAAGETSEQIDLAIFDRQYSPLWFRAGSQLIVPAESIYAVFEVKQEMDAANVEYAANKAASVRRLQRTSAQIVDIYGTHDGPPIADRPILGGIVTLRTSWVDGVAGKTGVSNLAKHEGDHHLDLGLSLTDAAFDRVGADANLTMLDEGEAFSAPGTQLIFFVMHLFRRLQALGTAPAVDLAIYERALSEVDVSRYDDSDLDAEPSGTS